MGRTEGRGLVARNRLTTGQKLMVWGTPSYQSVQQALQSSVSVNAGGRRSTVGQAVRSATRRCFDNLTHGRRTIGSSDFDDGSALIDLEKYIAGYTNLIVIEVGKACRPSISTSHMMPVDG